MLRATAFTAALCVACISSSAYAALDAEKCKQINDAVAIHGQAMVESFGPAYGFTVAQTRYAIKVCAKLPAKSK